FLPDCIVTDCQGTPHRPIRILAVAFHRIFHDRAKTLDNSWSPRPNYQSKLLLLSTHVCDHSTSINSLGKHVCPTPKLSRRRSAKRGGNQTAARFGGRLQRLVRSHVLKL